MISLALKAAVSYLTSYSVFLVAVLIGTLIYLLSIMPMSAHSGPWNLVSATEHNAILVVRALIAEDADVDMTRQRTALHVAAEKGKLEIVDVLLAAGADIHRCQEKRS